MKTEAAAAEKIKSRAKRKTQVGLVISDRMMKTIIVRVDQLVRHPLYHRVTKRSSSFKAHDEKSQAKVGDWVKLMETRPYSKDKRWRMVEVIRQASSAPPVPEQESEIIGRERQLSNEAAKLAAEGEPSQDVEAPSEETGETEMGVKGG